MAQMSKFKTIPLNLIITINFACVGVSPEMKTKRLLLKIDTNLSIYFHYFNCQDDPFQISS
jgi:hypothetical protein